MFVVKQPLWDHPLISKEISCASILRNKEDKALESLGEYSGFFLMADFVCVPLT